MRKFQVTDWRYVILLIYLASWCRYASVYAVFIPWLDDDPFQELHETDNQIESGSKLPPVLPPRKLSDENRSLPERGKVPTYVVDHCPLVHLYSEEKYWPADISDYVTHFKLTDRCGTPIIDQRRLSLNDLKSHYAYKLLNGSSVRIPSDQVYMSSLNDFDKDPRWLLGYPPEYGTGHIKNAPAVLFIADKGNGWVDAFWFYFYPFNLGAFVMGYGPWGNHVGDWEHSLVRFYKDEPKYVWMSAHGGGGAYRYEALEKVKKLRRENGRLTPEIIYRPLIFSARGTHANYASVGQHSHDVPFFFMPLSDFTDRGPMWDPSLNFCAYTLDDAGVTPCGLKEQSMGTSWVHYGGRWGDKQLSWSDPRQKWCPVQWRYIDGPTGPLSKHLDRVSLCPQFKWWNFWRGCPARRLIKNGVGLDAEKNDLLGDNCGILLYKIRPKWLRALFRFFMWRGLVCFVADYFTG